MTRTSLSRASALLGLALVLHAGAPRALAAQEFVLVAHPSLAVDALDAITVQRIFLKQADRIHGTRVKPVDQVPESPVRVAFLRRVVRRPASTLRAYWQQQLWSGGDHPPEMRTSDEEVLYFVRTTPGGIGYVSAGTDTFGVKVLTLK